MFSIKNITIVLFASILLAGCGPRMSPEELAQFQEKQRHAMEAYMARVKQAQAQQQAQQRQGSAQSPTQVSAAPAAQALAPSEGSLAAKINAMPQLSADTGVEFIRMEDGFTANGERYIDPEGQITKYGFDGRTGDVTYMAKVDADEFVIKFVRVTTGAEPVTIATVTRNRNGNGLWKVSTVTGKHLAGGVLFMNSRGFVVIRGTTGFWYNPGVGIRSIAAPNGYHIAAYQSGDIASTKYILLEKNGDGGLLGATKALGTIFGAEGNFSFALYNIETQKMVQVQVDHPLNRSVYDYHGQGVTTKNSDHYFWRISWFRTKAGVYAVVTINGIQKVIGIHLDSGFKKELFHRSLGILSLSSRVLRNGKVAVTADLGFGNRKTIDDLEKFMSQPSGGNTASAQ